VSKIFEALDKAGKDKTSGEPPTDSWWAKVGPPQIALDSHTPNPSADEYDRLRHKIAGILPATGSKALMFVSASRAEDSAAITVSFAYTVAWNGESVILIDANRQHSMLHRIFGSDQGPGMSELVSGRAGIKEVLRETDARGLYFIPAGGEAKDPLSPVKNIVLMGFLNTLKESVKWIIVNSPSVNSKEDIATLCGMVDGIILIISAEKTRWEDALNTKQQLSDADANIIGAVFAGSKTHIPDWVKRWL
jgi:Mrp family chromosome partitioning ATPase